jgi:hypothetical protein
VVDGLGQFGAGESLRGVAADRVLTIGRRG